jgi:3-mercaptopyruvate sulfurtransferase SseA
MLALKLAGATEVSVYDGAWAEWGSRKDTPILRD